MEECSSPELQQVMAAMAAMQKQMVALANQVASAAAKAQSPPQQEQQQPKLRRSPRRHKPRSPPVKRKSPPVKRKTTSAKKLAKATRRRLAKDEDTVTTPTLQKSRNKKKMKFPRAKKTPEEQTLRKKLVIQLYRYDVDLVNGVYTLPGSCTLLMFVCICICIR